MYSHLWDQLRAKDPQHSERYAKRWRDLAERGEDLDGEARFVTALAAPGAHVLDAGSGQGRLGGYLAQRGYLIAGVDLDEVLVEEARAHYPEAEWRVGDLATFDLRSLRTAAPHTGHAGVGFDVIVSAGNVLTFIDPVARAATIANLARALTPQGRLVTGFGVGRGYTFSDYEQHLQDAGLIVQHRFESWDMRPFDAGSDFLVCVAVLNASSSAS